MRFHWRFTSIIFTCLFSNFYKKLVSLTRVLSSVFDEQETSNFKEFLVNFRGLLVIYTLFEHVTHLILYLNASKYLGKCGHFTAVGYLIVCSLLWTHRIYGELTLANDQSHLVIFKYLIRRFYRNYIPLLIYILLTKYVTSLGNEYNSLTSLFVVIFNDNNGIIWWYIVSPFFAYFIFLTKKERIPSVYFISFALIIVFCDATQSIQYAPFLVRQVSLFFKCSLLVILYYHIEKVKQFRKWRKFLKLNFITAFLLMLFYFNLLRNSSEQYDTNIKSVFMYYWLIYLLILCLLVPMRLTDVFEERFLTKMSNISFIRYLCHRYALYIVFDYMPGIRLDDEPQQMNIWNYDFGRFFLVLKLSYLFSFVFYYLVEIHLMKMHSLTCSQITSFFEKKTPEISEINI